MTLQAWRTVLNTICGDYKRRWPDEQSRIIFHSTKLTYTQRISVLTFLYGNLRDANLVYAFLHPQFGADPREHDHARRFLTDLAASTTTSTSISTCSRPSGSSSTARSTCGMRRPRLLRARCIRGSASA